GGGRLSPAQLMQTLAVDTTQTLYPARSTVIIVDDVITRGSSFNAAKTLLRQVPGVQHVAGVFLAKTI
ncbi:hypothetical protein, partial [Pseudomonas sp. DCB_BG]|uniref:hypothetical protein n=1 Tax=Pseudomonas sp. DCB_BG TaxID=2993595 RepID=UPI0022497B8A